ncbi:MAG: hypothetical protein OEW02_02440 [Myxococcales bacterium]|nr:hypothetical protein [Myxococcales bacterium]MDH5566098.1 hypothetical protein [Myxococcales bacterium]
MRSTLLIWASALSYLCLSGVHAEEGNLPVVEIVTPQAAAFAPFDFTLPLAALAGVDRAPAPPLWLPAPLEIRKGAGFAMSRPVRMGETDLKLGVSGPIVHRKNLGVALEVRF